MKITNAIALPIVLVFGAVAFAQDNPKVEVSIDYSYIHANPQNNDIIKPFSLNGGGGAAAFYFNNHIGIEAEFEGYGSFTHSLGIPAGNLACPGSANCFVTAEGNLFTYNIGPIVKFRSNHFEPFVEATFGGAHSNFYGSLFTSCGGASSCVGATNSPSNNAFDFIIGGGIDIPVTKSFAIRPVQLDYVLTRFGNGFTGGNNNQSNLRYQAGLIFRFGGAPAPPPNRSLVASCSANRVAVYADSGDSVIVRVEAGDPISDFLTYTWTATGGTIDGTGTQVRWNSTGVASGRYRVSARLVDRHGGTTGCSAYIRVEPRPNRPPTMGCSVDPSSVQPGDRVRIAATPSDPDNDALTITWRTNGGRVVGSGSNVQLDTTGLAAGRYAVIGNVDDGRGGVVACHSYFIVEAPPPPPHSNAEVRLALRSIYFPTALPTAAKPDVGLIQSQQATLTSLAADFKEYLAKKPDAHLLLGGHADHRGPAEFNRSLSERRVEITRRFLISEGVAEGNIIVRAYGEEKELTTDEVKQLVEQHPNLSQENKDRIINNLQTVTLAQNRRVDITLSSTGQQSVRQFPFNAEDSLTLLSPKAERAKRAGSKRP